MGRASGEMVTVTQAHKCAWGALLMASATLGRKINAQLEAQGHISLELYDVLLALEEQEDHRMRMSDLAQVVVFSPSGLTRVVDRLESKGFVTRLPCDSDRRSTFAVLTDAGRAAREAAWPVYEAALEEVWASQMSRDEAFTMFQALSRALGGFNRAGCGTVGKQA